ncbi:MAG: signal recognition particle protein [Proteobacteria bacterium]|nr:signal recognition particle protein [Pseudomonadota bacterium]
MFNQLSERLTQAVRNLRGLSRLSESNIQETLDQIRKALLEADVALPAVNQFIQEVSQKAIGQATIGKTQPGETLIKLVQDELTHLLGDAPSEINLNAPSPIVILMAGLQGSGKTTSSAKLAQWLQTTKKKSVMLTSADVYRPAAIDQLATLAKQVGAAHFPSTPQDLPLDIAQRALEQAKKQFVDILIIDTAGRLHIDEELMTEISTISQKLSPTEILLVVDSMSGQDAANVAKTFNEQLPLTGVILTKTDGDARGGAALSMRIITGKPIKFMGTGEKMDGLSAFFPDRVAARILGMGDIVSLVEEAQQKIDKQQAEKMAKKLQKGQRFDFNDFLDQLEQMKKMGGVQSMLSKLPMMGQLPAKAAALMDEKLFIKMEAIIRSMTEKERLFPALITNSGSRKQRVAKGSGTSPQDIARFLKQFTQMEKMLKKFQGNKMAKRLQQMQGQLPPEWQDKF